MSPMPDHAIREEAVRLHDALLTAQPLAPPRERLAGFTIGDAYRCQRELIALRVARGARPIGRKVGLTSDVMQQMMGVRQPDYGVLLDDMLVDEASGVDARRLIAPRVEAEIAFVLERPVEGADVTVDTVLAATGSVRAALEIIDSRVADWRIGIEDTIADNASSALFVLGSERAVAEVDLLAERAEMTVGANVVRGTGAAVLGHPAEAVAWLARTLAPHGEGLRAGDIVLPGAVAAALPIQAGDVVRASYSTLGEMEVRIR